MLSVAVLASEGATAPADHESASVLVWLSATAEPVLVGLAQGNTAAYPLRGSVLLVDGLEVPDHVQPTVERLGTERTRFTRSVLCQS